MVNELSKKRLITIIEMSGLHPAQQIADTLGVDLNYVRKKAFAHSISLKVQKTEEEISEIDKLILQNYSAFSAPEFCEKFKIKYQLAWRRANKLGVKFRYIKPPKHNTQTENTFEEELFFHKKDLATI